MSSSSNLKELLTLYANQDQVIKSRSKELSSMRKEHKELSQQIISLMEKQQLFEIKTEDNVYTIQRVLKS